MISLLSYVYFLMCEILLQILNAKTAARTLNHDLLIG